MIAAHHLKICYHVICAAFHFKCTCRIKRWWGWGMRTGAGKLLVNVQPSDHARNLVPMSHYRSRFQHRSVEVPEIWFKDWMTALSHLHEWARICSGENDSSLLSKSSVIKLKNVYWRRMRWFRMTPIQYMKKQFHSFGCIGAILSARNSAFRKTVSN